MQSQMHPKVLAALWMQLEVFGGHPHLENALCISTYTHSAEILWKSPQNTKNVEGKCQSKLYMSLPHSSVLLKDHFTIQLFHTRESDRTNTWQKPAHLAGGGTTSPVLAPKAPGFPTLGYR